MSETANRAEVEQRQDATKKDLIRPILFLYYEVSLIPSNLNSKLFGFYCVRSNVGTTYILYQVVLNTLTKLHLYLKDTPLFYTR